MLLATKPPVAPAAPFVPVRMSLDQVSAGPDGATGEWMRGQVQLEFDLRPADAPNITPTTAHIQSALKDGTKIIDFTHTIPVTPSERAAATAIAQAFEGSHTLSKAVPFVEGEVADNTSRLVIEDAAGTKLMYTEPEGAPDHPGDAKLHAAINAYTEASGVI